MSNISVPVPAHLQNIRLSTVSAPKGAAPPPVAIPVPVSTQPVFDINKYVIWTKEIPSIPNGEVKRALAHFLFGTEENDLVRKLKAGERLPLWERVKPTVVDGIKIYADQMCGQSFNVYVSAYEEYRP